jgi:hypothetical protein
LRKREAKFPLLDRNLRIPIERTKLDMPPLEKASPLFSKKSSQISVNIFGKPEPPTSSTPPLQIESPYSRKKSQISVNIFMKPEPASATPSIMKPPKKLIPSKFKKKIFFLNTLSHRSSCLQKHALKRFLTFH